MDSEELINIRVKPNSSKSSVEISTEGEIILYLNSPPVEGKANKECVRLLSGRLGVRKSAISIVRGEKGRNKVLKIEGETAASVAKKLGL